MGDICRRAKVSTPSQLVNDNIKLDIVIEANNVVAYRSINKAFASLSGEINKQAEFSKDHSNMSIPAEVMKLEPYIVIEFKADGGQFYKIPKDTAINCKVYTLCKYYAMLNSTDLTYLIDGSDFVQTQVFKDIIKSIDPNATIVIDALWGVRIITVNTIIDITCSFKCIMVKSSSGDNIYETLSVAWNHHMANCTGKAFKETVSRSSGLDTIAYIYFIDYRLISVLGDEQFMKKIMHVV